MLKTTSYKLLGGLVLLVLILPLLSSQVYRTRESIELKVPFEVDGAAASSSATCNISIQYPNSTYLARNESMVNMDNGEFNYTIVTANTQTLGIYSWVAFCCEVAKCSSGYDKFEITYTGKELTTANGIMYVIFLIIAFFIFILCVYGSAKIPWDNNRNDEGQVVSINDLKWLKLFLMVSAYLTFIFIISISYNITENFLFIDYASGFFYVLYIGSLAVFFPIMVILPWAVIYMVFQDRRVKKTIERGLQPR